MNDMTDHTPAAQAAMQEAVRNAIRKAYDDGYNDAKMAPDNCSTYCVQRAEREGSAVLLSKLRAPVADDQWPTLSDLHLQALVFAYNEGYSKAIDGRKFKNPFSPEGSQGAAWQLGTDDGTEAREKMASAPVAGEAQKPSDADILALAGDSTMFRTDIGKVSGLPYYWGEAATVVAFARKLLSRYAAPQASDAVRDALVPFAALEDADLIGTAFEGKGDDAEILHFHRTGKSVTLGDFRRARAALSAQPGAQQARGGDA